MTEAPFTSEEKYQRGSAADLEEWAQRQPAIGRCIFCPDWAAQGTIEEVRKSSIEHRKTVHPEIARTKKRRPSKPNLMRWRTNLDEEQSLEISEERGRRMRLLGIEEPSEEGSSSF